jgi:hypothetical protein
MIDIRPVTVADAAAFLVLAHQLDQESRFMMLEPAERQISVADQADQLAALLARPNQMSFVAAAGDQLVGYLGAETSRLAPANRIVTIVRGSSDRLRLAASQPLPRLPT